MSQLTFSFEAPFVGLNTLIIVALCNLIQLLIDAKCEDNLRTARETCAKFTYFAEGRIRRFCRCGES
jgi:hypothetical protein